jgi:hypothetical protein
MRRGVLKVMEDAEREAADKVWAAHWLPRT